MRKNSPNNVNRIGQVDDGRTVVDLAIGLVRNVAVGDNEILFLRSHIRDAKRGIVKECAEPEVFSGGEADRMGQTFGRSGSRSSSDRAA